MERVITLVDKLAKSHVLSREEFSFLLDNIGEEDSYLYEKAREAALANYGNKIYVRGLMEFSNYCKNDCYYCGIRRSNQKASRYRLSPEQIMECCSIGYGLGFRTFVLQGGEDPWFTDEKIAYLVERMKKQYPDCAVTLSVGEKGYDTYKRWFDAGADRYLLRHETANPCHYASLHPPQMSSEYRKECLHNLKAIGYQTGCGIMAGSPYQTTAHIAEDLEFMHGLQPEMVGIGPFIPHHDTPFKDRPAPDPSAAGHCTAHAAGCASACHHGSGDHRAGWKGTGRDGRGQCGNAKSVAHGSEKKVHALRQ